MADLNIWSVAALLLLLGLIPCGVEVLRGRTMPRLVALEMASCVTAMILLVLAQQSKEASFYDVAIAFAVLSWPAGLVFAHFLERWI
jgi:multisubunit Na+/H+ antiporter MnhF subunit